jgi:general secretion pathway protein G
MKRSHPRSAQSPQAGFTLIELMLVLVILITQISTFGTALDAYEVDTGSYPATQAGLRALVVQPPDVPNWRGPYLASDIPDDPYHHPYVYEYPGKLNPSGYDIISMGPDGQLGTPDDIANAGITSR